MPTMHEFVMAHGNLDIEGEGVTHLNVPAASVMNSEADIRLALASLEGDRPDLDEIHAYMAGDQTKPYAPTNTTAQTRRLQDQAITNLMPLLVGLPTQVLKVAGYRRGRPEDHATSDPLPEAEEHKISFSPEWRAWLRERMISRQHLLWQTTFTYGYAYVAVDNRGSQPRLRLMPSRRTTGLFYDSANEIVPEVMVSVVSYPDAEAEALGVLECVDHEKWYTAYFDDEDNVYVDQDSFEFHDMGGTPVVRLTCYLDDEGRASGMVDRAIRPQNRVNQAVFSTDTTANNSSFKVRWAAGLVPSYKMDANGNLVIDPSTGKPIPEPIEVTQARMLMSDKPDAKFGTLDETPMQGMLSTEDQALRNFAAANQFPPHIFLGNISNLSAEALDAAEAQFRRLVEYFQNQFSAFVEELMRMLARALGDDDGAESYGGTVRWAPFGMRAFATWMDGLAKAVDSMGVPQRGAWAMIPNVESATLEQWETLKAQQDADEAMAMAAELDAVARREMAPQPAVVTEEAQSTEQTIF